MLGALASGVPYIDSVTLNICITWVNRLTTDTNTDIYIGTHPASGTEHSAGVAIQLNEVVALVILHTFVWFNPVLCAHRPELLPLSKSGLFAVTMPKPCLGIRTRL
jgi:hypothetical protein